MIPYKNISEEVLWQAFAMYHFIDEGTLTTLRMNDNFLTNLVQMLKAKDFRASFEDTLSGLPDTEVMFLLTTFAHMAMSRDFDRSRAFICYVLEELLSVGFLNEMTSNSCAKGCRDHISTILKVHTRGISFLLQQFARETKLVESSVSV